MKNYNLNLITAPASEPVTLDEARLWMKIPDNITADNVLITSLIKWARECVERYTKRALFTQTWELVSNCSFNPVYFPYGQLASVTSVKVVANDETETTETATNYTVTTGDSGKLFLKSGFTWTTTDRYYDSFKVRFVCGWDDRADIPEVYKTSIKELVSYRYENRNYTDKDAMLHLSTNCVGKLY